MVVGAAGDCGIYLDVNDNDTPDAAEVVVRGTVGTNAIIPMVWCKHFLPQGQLGAKPCCFCASGTIDVTLEGVIRAP